MKKLLFFIALFSSSICLGQAGKIKVTDREESGITSTAHSSAPSCFSAGIRADGTDQTGRLNAMLSNGDNKGIVLDMVGGGAIRISGAVNGLGKTITFVPGTYLTGSGSISNFIHSSGNKQKCYDTSVSVSMLGSTSGFISPWVFGAKDDGTDCAAAFQKTIDLCTNGSNKISDIKIPPGNYICNSPLILYSWNGKAYSNFNITMESDGSFSGADGYAATITFGYKNRFGIGVQHGKGVKIIGIKAIGGWKVPSLTAYQFYTTTFLNYTDSSSRDSTHSPHCAFVVDPFGSSVPADGGYPGNDAYGRPLSTYYRSNNSGSTGITFRDCVAANWVGGLMTSPSGTANAELILVDGFQVQNCKWGISSCQDQEKLNIVRRVKCWGVVHTLFISGIYGSRSIGNWSVEDVNIAGLTNTFAYNPQSGYFPSYFKNIYAESLGSIGYILSRNATTIINSTFNFAYFNNAGAFNYISNMIPSGGVTYIGCQFRLYGEFKPVTIDAPSGAPNFFINCAFDVPPIYPTGFSNGNNQFENCVIGNIGSILNPYGPQNMQASAYSGSFAYGNIRAVAGTYAFNIKSDRAAAPMPINRTGSGYKVTISINGSGYREAKIRCPSDELKRVFVGDVILASATNVTLAKVLGMVTAVGNGTFTVTYIPSWLVSGGDYHLWIWLQLNNIAFTGDVTAGNDTIKNVNVLAGNPSYMVKWGGLLNTKSFPQSDPWGANMVRMIYYNASAHVIVVDRNAAASATENLFTNTDATPDPGIPTATAGNGAGSSSTVSIVRGDDRSFQLKVITGHSPASDTIATISLAIPFAAGKIPVPIFTPANANAAALTGASQPYLEATQSGLLIFRSGSSALSALTTYAWNILNQ